MVRQLDLWENCELSAFAHHLSRLLRSYSNGSCARNHERPIGESVPSGELVAHNVFVDSDACSTHPSIHQLFCRRNSLLFSLLSSMVSSYSIRYVFYPLPFVMANEENVRCVFFHRYGPSRYAQILMPLFFMQSARWRLTLCPLDCADHGVLSQGFPTLLLLKRAQAWPLSTRTRV